METETLKTPTKELKQAFIKLGDITPSKTNPRKEFDQESIIELASSIREKGVLQPVLLRPVKGGKTPYELVCGERRYRASILVMGAIKTRDAIPAVIRDLTDDEALELQIIENLQRQNVHPMDEAAAFAGLVKLKNYSAQEISKRTGKNVKYIAERLRLNDLLPEWQKALYKNRITLVTADQVCKFPKDIQKQLWEDEGEGDNKIQLNNYTLNQYLGKLNAAPFDLMDPTLNKEMGPCTNCRFNSASSNMFPDQVSVPMCNNIKCFKKKADASYDVEIKKAVQDPAIELICSDYNTGKKTEKLRKEGQKVLEWKDVSIEDAPDPMESWEEYKENNFDEEYDSEEEVRKNYEREIKDYNKDLEEYNKKVSSGKFIKAFVVEGNNCGKYVYITLKKSKTIGIGSASGPNKSFQPTKLELESEIERIRANEKRKKELDLEKINDKFSEQLSKTKAFNDNTGALKKCEKIGLVMMLLEYSNYEARSKFSKQLGGDHSYPYLSLYKKLNALKDAPLDVQLNSVIRILLSDKMHSTNTSADRNGKAAVLQDIVMAYSNKEASAIIKDQENEAAGRGERVNERISAIKKKIKDLPGTDRKSSATKSKKAKK
jgi:ParB family chromosome partitioning protein